ncbi:TRAP transporter substrate-binding protein DctP [Brevibacterium album]|uniref:TRAP transporter substrate-binding protein DctP n=1 Tax=Brevibacterium album TaxID=417948 RepID=UPI0004083D01|nr:TRAP transporter substrate-binding protein DctP [Brevibacterium album]
MRISTRSLCGAATAAGAAFALAACGGVAGAGGSDTGAASWQGANYMPEQNSFSRAFVGVTDFLAEEDIADTEVFHQESLLAAADILPGIADGRANVGIINPFYYPGELPLTNVASVPFMSQDPASHTDAMNEMYRSSEVLQAEYDKAGVHLVSFVPVATTIVGSSSPIETVEDFGGKQIRAVGLLSDTISQIGANPVSISAGEVYQSVETGVIDGYTSYPFDIAIQNSFHEVAPHVADPGFGVYSVGAILMNGSDWDGLTDEQRTAIEAQVDTFAADASGFVASDLEESCTAYLESGSAPVEFSEEEQKKLRDEVGDSQIESWKADAVAAGVEEAHADAFLEELQSQIADREGSSDADLSIRPCLAQAG